MGFYELAWKPNLCVYVVYQGKCILKKVIYS